MTERGGPVISWNLGGGFFAKKRQICRESFLSSYRFRSDARSGLMQLLAAATTTADKLSAIPADFWLKLALGVVALVVGFIILRKVAGMNKVVLTVLALFFATMGGFNWIYERSEPAWATPFVSVVAGFVPTKAKLVGPAKSPELLAAKKR